MKDHLTPDVIQNISSLILLAFYFFNEQQKKKRIKKLSSKPEDLLSSLEKESKIYPILWEMMVSFRAMRIYIIQFHNGDKYYSGQSIQRYSMTHEIHDPAIGSIKKSYTAISMDVEMNSMVQLVIKDTILGINDVNKMMESEGKDILMFSGVKSVYMYLIRNKKFQPIGLLYLTFPITNGLHEQAVSSIRLKVNELENILTKDL